MKKYLRYGIGTAVAVAVVAVVVALWKNFYGEENIFLFSTETIQFGNVATTISASGTVEPEELVNVGAQVSGKIMSFGVDTDGNPVDYRSTVTKGMVLAHIDEVLYEAALSEAKASKLKAQVQILSAKATINQAQAKLVLAERNWIRAQELHPKGSMARSEYDSSEAEYLVAKANVEVAEASLKEAEAQMEIAEAAMVKAERNLSYCVIVSPVDGVIVDRRVSVGQTLVSNMSASSIFLIATDLKKMQVWASVNEADIGSIHNGMPVVFTVDTFPDEEFEGVVTKVRLNATMSQNVVTYVVEIDTDNSNGRLIPYLTANVKFIKAMQKATFSVSNAALRYRPDPEVVSPAYRGKLDDYLGRGKHTVWVPDGKQTLRPIPVEVGLSSGAAVAVSSPELKEGMTIVTAHRQKVVAAGDKKKEDLSSPFVNKVPTRVRNSAKGK
ncbi:MAG: efflux RND transporter periplasmic adaptor subunit [Victivallaceae bacterium]|nr:efflux RND transporter periplasmic adaptor subunit [Victivallaceae bacterium]